ncbi:MAG: AAA family ATPase [Clostridium sp.]|nr:MAG: AAA family ATPase [Clostridium sp.]
MIYYKNKLEYMAAVYIEGCKWCGKSTTARQFAKSYIEFQDPDKKAQYDKMNQTKPSLFLEGEKPRLFDEWQMYPVVWDSIRTDVDHTSKKGQYILTGSARPAEDSVMHTGTGRISKLLMRPMSLFESKESNGKVSLKDIIDGKDISAVSNLSFDDLINAMRRADGLNH